MKRIRWLGAQWLTSLAALTSKMKANAFTQEKHDGFVVERVRDSFVEARFIEKLIFKETIFDPFGNEEVFDRISYRQVEFSLFADFPNIELVEPPRSTHAYVSKLLELSDFSLSISSLHVNLLDWLEELQTRVDRTFIIDSHQIAGFEIETGIIAKALLKGEKDVREALINFADGRPYILEKLQARVQLDRKVVSVHLANNGSAKISEEVFGDFLPLLRASVPNSTLSKSSG
jgi:hypothetical protein